MPPRAVLALLLSLLLAWSARAQRPFAVQANLTFQIGTGMCLDMAVTPEGRSIFGSSIGLAPCHDGSFDSPDAWRQHFRVEFLLDAESRELYQIQHVDPFNVKTCAELVSVALDEDVLFMGASCNVPLDSTEVSRNFINVQDSIGSQGSVRLANRFSEDCITWDGERFRTFSSCPDADSSQQNFFNVRPLVFQIDSFEDWPACLRSQRISAIRYNETEDGVPTEGAILEFAPCAPGSGLFQWGYDDAALRLYHLRRDANGKRLCASESAGPDYVWSLADCDDTDPGLDVDVDLSLATFAINADTRCLAWQDATETENWSPVRSTACGAGTSLRRFVCTVTFDDDGLERDYFDTNDWCASCEGGFGQESGCRDCETPSQVASSSSPSDRCSACMGSQQDANNSCLTCLPGWSNPDFGCNSCGLGRDFSDFCEGRVCTTKRWIDGLDNSLNCLVCRNGFSEETQCTVCRNGWTGDNCDICPVGLDENLDCAEPACACLSDELGACLLGGVEKVQIWDSSNGRDRCKRDVTPKDILRHLSCAAAAPLGLERAYTCSDFNVDLIALRERALTREDFAVLNGIVTILEDVVADELLGLNGVSRSYAESLLNIWRDAMATADGTVFQVLQQNQQQQKGNGGGGGDDDGGMDAGTVAGAVVGGLAVVALSVGAVVVVRRRRSKQREVKAALAV